ncbi:ammonia-dependent NAD(+) synthetase [Bhargavaea beijingensis]|uniref:NH(3)-dependent NAD(+) synthetase n=1 Tax=Bhargavaea beijingensis TaxID=426756 RepID=A0A1G7B2A6_9BACL|nr:ammonia-dependent NAD(+) synthetase [Bhargavaea beijingensis]MCW1928314.1 ammonia-dependent NAD(+) synthetase [Bhargavaea beijingensis]RSK29691.1 ammonia-dependent NAD(+) synthetase [Bhargavaea beijingensis]SDE21153.1 NAD+ synthase [Bhargavaea beijingensis]
MTLQEEIIRELKVKPEIDPQEEIRVSVEFMKDYARAHPFLEGFVLGISGGQDSTLAGKLAQMAVDELNEEENTERYQFHAVRLPYGEQFDEQDVDDAMAFISPSESYRVDIRPAVDASAAALAKAGVPLVDFVKGNEKARERMKAQFAIAAMKKAVVIGTDHAAEAITGFYTKFGDGAADIMPLFRLNKRQGRALLKELGCPEHLYNKVPTADLEEDRPAIPDEVALGLTYDDIDDYLEGKTISPEAREKLEDYYLKSRHKRHLPINVYDDFWRN